MTGVKILKQWLTVVGICALAYPNHLLCQDSAGLATHWQIQTDSIKALRSNFVYNSAYFENLLPKENYKPASTIEAKTLGNLYLNLGYAYETYDRNYYRALELYKKGKLLHEMPLDTIEFKSWAFAVHYIANIYTRFGDYVRSAHLFQILYDERSKRDQNDPDLEGLQLDLAMALHSGGKTVEAIEIIKSYKFLKPENINYSYLLLAEMIQSTKDQSKVDGLLNKILQQLNQLSDGFMEPTQSERWSSYYQLKSIAELNQNKVEQALSSINNAIEKYEEQSGRSLAKMFNTKARIILQNGHYQIALRTLDTSMLHLGFNMKLNIPEPPIQLENNLVDNYKIRGDIHFRQFLDSNTVSILDTVIYWYKKSVDVDFFIRDQLIFENSRAQINASNKDICEKGLKACLLAFNLTLDTSYLQKAFDFSEYNKAANLRDKSNRLTIENHVKQDSQKVIQLSLLKSQLGILYRDERLILGDEQTSLQKSRISNLELKIKEIESSQIQFEQNSNQNFLTTFSAQKIQKQLLYNESNLISYFVGQKMIYRFILDGNKIHLDTFSFGSKEKNQLDELVSLTSRPWNLQSEGDDYNKLCFAIGDIFYPPQIKVNLVHYSLDGALHSIALPSILIDSINNEYLIHKYSITYQYSPSIWYQSISNEHIKYSIDNSLLIAPQEYDNSEIATLPFDPQLFKKELPFDKIIYLTGRNASFDSIQTYISQFDILHFHTHGSFSPYNQLECYDQPMYVDEVERASLKAQLVVLSACETGLGNNHTAEGPLSMARGFAMAGVPTTVMTLWKVNNNATQNILSNFYKNLGSGFSSASSLRMAQLNYLNSHAGHLSSPYYWSGILHTGKSIQLKTKNPMFNSNPLSWIVFGLMLVLFLLYWTKKRA